MKISSIKALEILDSRGKPTVRAFVTLEDGSTHSSSVPSGASTGIHEALELRDKDPKRYNGFGVKKAVENVNNIIGQALANTSIVEPKHIDEILRELDGTENKGNLGANAILSVSQAVIKAAAHSQNIPVWKFLNQYYFRNSSPQFPRLFVNVVNGGAHADWNFDIQEFMIVPKPSLPSESLPIASEIFHSLHKLLKERKLSTLVADEGGYSPALNNNEEVLDLIIEAAKNAGYENGLDFHLALDAAASGFYDNGKYVFKKTNQTVSADELINYYNGLQKKYSILSFEDPFAEDDWQTFTKFTEIANGNNFFTVGDDLYVTNPKRIEKGIKENATNAALIKTNQIGTVFEAVHAIQLARITGWKIIISHRSGETEDPFIADLAYASGADFIKTGSMSRSERLAKYNRLLEIEAGL